MNQKCGYIALIGAPNSGKSTLLNAILRKKISIVSNKPQTTRRQILGIITLNENQLLFLDTPGFVSRSLSGGAALNAIPWDACQDADVICYLIDATRGWRETDTKYLQKILQLKDKKIFVLGTKIDKLKKAELSKITEEFQQKLNEITNPAVNTEAPVESSIPQNENYIHLLMSTAKRPDSIASLLMVLSQNIPNSEWLYDKDSVTDSSENFVCAEFIREQLFRQLGEEIPYQTSVVIDKLEKSEQIVHIYATIKVMRESQKAIVIGIGGSRLKTIGQFARESLEKYLGKKIFLKIFVKKGDV